MRKYIWRVIVVLLEIYVCMNVMKLCGECVCFGGDVFWFLYGFVCWVCCGVGLGLCGEFVEFEIWVIYFFKFVFYFLYLFFGYLFIVDKVLKNNVIWILWCWLNVFGRYWSIVVFFFLFFLFRFLWILLV